MARPTTYTDETTLCVCTRKAKSKLQAGSERRAIVNTMVDNGGSMTVAQLCDHFGFDIRNQVRSLLNNGWLEVAKLDGGAQ